MADEFQIQTSQNVSLRLEYASLGDRIMATIIDELIRISYGIIAFMIYDATFQWAGGVNLFFFLLALPIVFYHLFFEIFNQGQTPGKSALGLQVSTLDGTPVPVRSYILRWLFRIIDVQLFYGLVAIIAIATSKSSQRIGDMVAGTTVVKRKNRHSIRSTVYEKQDEDYVPVYVEAKKLSAKDVELIKEVLNNLSMPQNERHVEALTNKLKVYLDVQPDEQPRKFLRTLVKDYTFLNS